MIKSSWSTEIKELPRPSWTGRISRVYTGIVDDDIYKRLARSTGFEWDEGNAPKVMTRQNVSSGECEQAFFVEPFVVVFDARHSSKEGRWQALGQTTAGRGLFLVFTIRGTLIRVIAARDMNRKEREVYGEVKAKIKEDPGV